MKESERSSKAKDLSQGESLVPRIPLWWRLIIMIITKLTKMTTMIIIKLTKLTTMIIIMLTMGNNLW